MGGLLLALTLIPAPLPAAGMGSHIQEPEDPGRILNLLDGLVERVQDSSPILAAIIRFLGFLVWLVLNIKYWGPSVLVTALVVVGVLVLQGRRHRKQPPLGGEEPEAESAM